VTTQDCAGLKIHLKLDTGMNRIGFRTFEEIEEALHLLKQAGCIVEGIFTHFCTADCDIDLMQKQYDKFVNTVQMVAQKIGINTSDLSQVLSLVSTDTEGLITAS
jgi:alanine racemase